MQCLLFEPGWGDGRLRRITVACNPDAAPEGMYAASVATWRYGLYFHVHVDVALRVTSGSSENSRVPRDPCRGYVSG